MSAASIRDIARAAAALPPVIVPSVLGPRPDWEAIARERSARVAAYYARVTGAPAALPRPQAIYRPEGTA